MAGKPGLALKIGSSDQNESCTKDTTRHSQNEAGVYGSQQQLSAHHDAALPDLWQRPLPSPAQHTLGVCVDPVASSQKHALDSSAGAAAVEGDETHMKLLKVASRKGARLADLIRKIDSAAAEREFPLEVTPGHPFVGLSAKIGAADAPGDGSAGRLRDAVREAAAKGLNLLISPSGGTPKSDASSSPGEHASGPGSSPGESTASLTPGQPSPPGAGETWSEILSPVKATWEAKVNSISEAALAEAGKIVQKLPVEARESASSVLDILGSAGAPRRGVWKRQTVVTSEGHLYEGEVNDEGQLHRDGYGRLTWPDGHWFQGEFVAGETLGLGRRAWPTGHAFSGMENKGAKHGLGIYTWPDGRRYEGEFRLDVKDGVGLMRWPSSRCYLGEWKKGLQDGDGIEWRSDGCFLTVYEAGRMLCDQQAPPELYTAFADIAAVGSIVLPAAVGLGSHAGADGKDVEEDLSCHDLSQRQSAAAGVEYGVFESRMGRRRGSARRIKRRASAAADESDDESVHPVPDTKPKWNLTVINGEVIALQDPPDMSSLSTSVLTIDSREKDTEESADLVLDDADLKSLLAADDGVAAGEVDARYQDMDASPVKSGKEGRGPPTPLPASASGQRNPDEAHRCEVQGDDSENSSLFDASPTSNRSSGSSSSCSEEGMSKGVRGRLHFTGSEKMDRIIEMLQGGTTTDMVEEDGDAGLAERLVEESDAQVKQDSSQSAPSSSSRASVSPVSPGMKSCECAMHEIADAQYPSLLVKSGRSLSIGSRNTNSASSQGSLSPSLHEVSCSARCSVIFTTQAGKQRQE